MPQKKNATPTTDVTDFTSFTVRIRPSKKKQAASVTYICAPTLILLYEALSFYKLLVYEAFS